MLTFKNQLLWHLAFICILTRSPSHLCVSDCPKEMSDLALQYCVSAVAITGCPLFSLLYEVYSFVNVLCSPNYFKNIKCPLASLFTMRMLMSLLPWGARGVLWTLWTWRECFGLTYFMLHFPPLFHLLRHLYQCMDSYRIRLH